MSVIIVNGIELGNHDRVQRQLEIIADADLNGRTVIVYDDLSVWRLSTIQSIFWTILCCDCLRRLFFGTDTLRPHAVLLALHPAIAFNPAIMSVYNRAILNANLVLPYRHQIVFDGRVPVYAPLSSSGVVPVYVPETVPAHVAVGGGHERVVVADTVPRRNSVLQRAASFETPSVVAAAPVVRRTGSLAPAALQPFAGGSRSLPVQSSLPVQKRELNAGPALAVRGMNGAVTGSNVPVGRRS